MKDRWWRESVNSLSMQLSFSLSASGSMDNLANAMFEVDGNVRGGRFEHKQLPSPSVSYTHLTLPTKRIV